MQRRMTAFVAMGLVLLLPGVVSAAITTIVAGNHLLLPNTPGQVVAITASGTDQLQGVNLNIVIGDGGADVGGSNTVPKITAVDAQGPGTIFFGNANPSSLVIYPAGLIAQESFLTQSGFIASADAAGGVLAFVTIDTTGFFAGSIPFLVNGIPSIGFPPSDWATSQTTADAINGSLTIVPEPSSIVIGLFAAAGMAAVVIRRRRSA